MTDSDWYSIAGIIATILSGVFAIVRLVFGGFKTTMLDSHRETRDYIDKIAHQSDTDIKKLCDDVEKLRDRTELYVPPDELDKRFERIENKIDGLPVTLELAVSRAVGTSRPSTPRTRNG